MLDNMASLRQAMEEMDAQDPAVAQAAKNRAAQILKDGDLSFTKMAELIEQRRLLLRPKILTSIKRMDHETIGDMAFRETGSALRRESQSFRQIADAIELNGGFAPRHEDSLHRSEPSHEMAIEPGARTRATSVPASIVSFLLRHPFQSLAMALLAVGLLYIVSSLATLGTDRQRGGGVSSAVVSPTPSSQIPSSSAALSSTPSATPSATFTGTPATPAPAPSATFAGTPAQQQQQQQQSAYWNTWFDGGTGSASNIVIANHTYMYSLDLSAFKYAALRGIPQSAGARADSRIQELLKDLSVQEVILTIKPMIPAGSGLRLMDDQRSLYTMKVDLSKIREPDFASAKKYSEGSMAISLLSKNVSAGTIQFPIFAETKGCAVIAFAIFKGLLPLDHLVQRISIGADPTSAPVCDSNDPERNSALTAGLGALCDVSLGMEGSGASVKAAGCDRRIDRRSDDGAAVRRRARRVEPDIR